MIKEKIAKLKELILEMMEDEELFDDLPEAGEDKDEDEEE